MTLTVLLDLRLTAEAVPHSRALLREILTDTRAFDGCLGVDVLVDTEDPTHLVLLERWATVEADAAYREWRAGPGASNLGSLLASAPHISKYITAQDV
jgi:quinol monooxygenase YgiN